MKKFVIALVPVALIALMNLWVFSNRDRFPDPIAMHWGANGQPDGFGSLETHMLWVNIGLGLVAVIWFAVSVIRTPTALRRLFQFIVGYLFVLLSLIMLQTLLIQIDLPTSQGAELGLWVFLLIVPVIFLIPLMLSRPEVVVTDNVAVKLRGLSFLNLPIDEISVASEDQVRASDFGGWGIRYAAKTTAFVPSSGPALLLTLKDESKVLIRSDRAGELASQINNQRNAK